MFFFYFFVEMANSGEQMIDNNYQKDKDDDNYRDDWGNDEEGEGDLSHPMAKLQQYASCEMVYNR